MQKEPLPINMDCNFLVCNGDIISTPTSTPPASIFLQNHSGSYTTTRTHLNASVLLFWERHLRRLAQSTSILSESRPHLFKSLKSTDSAFDSVIRPIVTESLRCGLAVILREKASGADEEVAISTLVCGNSESMTGFDVYLHLGFYVPEVFGRRESGASLAVVGFGREIAQAKFSEWVRVRKYLENLRPPLATELLLSNDGDQILEGSVTNFFVVCRRDNNETTGDTKESGSYTFEIQTAPISDGLLPGVIRQLIIEVCSSLGIPLREVAPSWSNRELWEEAFVTNSLRLIQHVEKIQAPSSWESLHSKKTWKDVTWEEKQFERPGAITNKVQKEIAERAHSEGYSLSDLFEQSTAI